MNQINKVKNMTGTASMTNKAEWRGGRKEGRCRASGNCFKKIESEPFIFAAIKTATTVDLRTK